jgi:hypothetical protein
MTSPCGSVCVIAAANERHGAPSEQTFESLPYDATNVRCAACAAPIGMPSASTWHASPMTVRAESIGMQRVLLAKRPAGARRAAGPIQYTLAAAP